MYSHLNYKLKCRFVFPMDINESKLEVKVDTFIANFQPCWGIHGESNVEGMPLCNNIGQDKITLWSGWQRTIMLKECLFAII